MKFKKLKQQKVPEELSSNLKKKLKARNKPPNKFLGLQATDESIDASSKVVKVSKIRRAATTENVEENYIVVPWASREEWLQVCQQFHEGKYKDSIMQIRVWQQRMPSLPVGVEATVLLLEAIVYDQSMVNNQYQGEDKELFTEDQARSLYSLAVIRYLNHISHLAAHSLGEPSTKLTREMSSVVDTPEWLVSLRNEVSHGACSPAIGTLRFAGNFIVGWLKEKYWKLSDSSDSTDTANSSDLFTVERNVEQTNLSAEISEKLAAYVAGRVYKLRGLQTIKDEQIVKIISNQNLSYVKTKVAVISLRDSLRGYILSHPSAFIDCLSQELIPSIEFYDDFVSMLNSHDNEEQDEFAFDKFFGLWLPIIKIVQTKGKLIPLLRNLCDLIVNPVHEKVWNIIGRWIDKLLEIIEHSGKKSTKHLVSLLQLVIKHPNQSILLYQDRLFRLTEPRLGADALRKLTFLTSIWLEDKPETKKRKKSTKSHFFTLNDIQNKVSADNDAKTPSNNSIRRPMTKWEIDGRGEEFWQTIPLGALM